MIEVFKKVCFSMLLRGWHTIPPEKIHFSNPKTAPELAIRKAIVLDVTKFVAEFIENYPEIFRNENICYD